VLDNLKSFLEGPVTNKNANDLFNIPISLDIPSSVLKSKFNSFTFGYVGGYIARSILNSIGGCKYCKNDIITKNSENSLIKARSYTKKSLMNQKCLKKLLNIYL